MRDRNRGGENVRNVTALPWRAYTLRAILGWAGRASVIGLITLPMLGCSVRGPASGAKPAVTADSGSSVGAIPPPAQAPDEGRAHGSRASELDPILNRLGVEGAIVSARIVDASSGHVLYERNADRATTPASNMKLFSSAAALEFFGPDHAFETYLYLAGEDLWLIGSGDPGFGDESIASKRNESTMAGIDRWADELLARGVRRLAGRVLYFDGVFDRELVHSSWGSDDLQYWYAAPVSGLNFSTNCVDIMAKPGEVGAPAILSIEPATTLVSLENKTTSGEGQPGADHARPEMRNHYIVSGHVEREGEISSAPVVDPGAFVADVVVEHLRSRGIVIEGGTQRVDRLPIKPGPDVTPLLLTPHRTKLVEILPRVNKNSQNLMSEALAKAVGRGYLMKRGNRDAVGSWGSGHEAMVAMLRERGIDAESFLSVDGSGLSRGNRVTARQISELLVAMRKSAHAKVFEESLAVGGVDGTIRSRFADAKGRVRAKTGYIGGVRSLSGYVDTDSGATIVFSIMYNNIPRKAGGIRDTRPFEMLQDEALGLMMKW